MFPRFVNTGEILFLLITLLNFNNVVFILSIY